MGAGDRCKAAAEGVKERRLASPRARLDNPVPSLFAPTGGNAQCTTVKETACVQTKPLYRPP